MCVSFHGHVKVIDYLISCGASRKTLESEGLVYACSNGDLHVIQ